MKIVAEAGCNHQGNFEIAKQMIRVAAAAGADYIKFQKRDCDYWKTINPDWLAAHPNIQHAFGETYYEHRKALEFSIEQHIELKEYCNNQGIGYACSVWDIYSAYEIIKLNPDYIKVPSAVNNNYLLIIHLIKYYSGNIHISLGMTTTDERDIIYSLFVDNNCLNRFIAYHCTSGYPVPFEQLYLNELLKMKNDYDEYGYSGHHLGIAVDIAAQTLGATWLERHFTLDRTMKGTDHAASLEPTGLIKLVRDTKAIKKALQYKHIDISPIEEEQRKKLKWKP